MKALADKVAVVTGAGSGIGRALALELAAQGCRLALADINSEALDQTHALIDSSHAVYTACVDVASADAVEQFAREVSETYGHVHLVINNAGATVVASVEQISYADFQWLMNVNFWGVVHGTRAFLPLLRQAEEGHIVNVSSAFGLIGWADQAAYSASKFAVRGFTESLRLELELERSSVRVSCVHPGGVKTNIAKLSRFRIGGDERREDFLRGFEKSSITKPSAAARTIVAGIKKNKQRILIGPDAHGIDWIQRMFPARYQALLRRVFPATPYRRG